MKIGFISLGCPKNQLDTEVMLHEVVAAGYELTSEDIDADIIIINTCAFIAPAVQESVCPCSSVQTSEGRIQA